MVPDFVDLALSRLPIPVEWYGTSHFYWWATDSVGFAEHLDELRAHPPAVMYPEGYHGHVQNPIQWGPLVGVADAVYGDQFTPGMGAYLAKGLAEPGVLLKRWEMLSGYLDAINGVTRPAPYVDFATQLYGNPSERLGFWAFWDWWSSYESPLGLGPRPPEPTGWLRRWHDRDGSSHDLTSAHYASSEAKLFAGLSFAYPPKSCLFCHPDDHYCRRLPDGSLELVVGEPCRYHRYSVCPNTEGWRRWWRLVMHKTAAVGFRMAFVDNCVFQRCWNAECEEGFRRWLQGHYDATLRARLFRVSTSLLADHGFESFWRTRGPDGPWQTHDAATDEGARMFPDADSYAGLYACRVEGPGRLYFRRAPATPPAAPCQYELTVHYRTLASAGARVEVRASMAGNPVLLDDPLGDSAQWAAHRARFTAPAAPLDIAIYLDREGPILVDELWLSVPSDPALRHPRFFDGLTAQEDPRNDQEQLLLEAARLYWESVIDENLALLRMWARELSADFELFTNSYFQRQGSDYYLVEGQAVSFESERRETGHPPGVYRPAEPGPPPRKLDDAPVLEEIVASNIFDYKWAGSRRLPHTFAYHVQSFRAHPDFPHNPDSAVLCHAEAAAFGGGAGVDLGLWSGAYTPWNGPYPVELRRRLRAVGRDFFDFIRHHPYLYEGLRPHADVGVAWHGLRIDRDLRYSNEIFDLCQALARRGVLWEILTAERANAANFGRLKAIVLHAVERLSDAQGHALIGFMRAGGTVVASGSETGSTDSYGFTRFFVGMRDEQFRLRAAHTGPVWPPVVLSGTDKQTHPVGRGRLINIPAGALEVDDLIPLVGVGLEPPRPLSVFGEDRRPALERLRVSAWQSATRFVVHLVNYDVALGPPDHTTVRPQEQFKIQLELPESSARPSSVRMYSPEPEGWNGQVEWTLEQARLVTITVPGVRIYQIVEIS